MGLGEIRQKIDWIDEQMKQLFLQRMDLAHQVAETKKHTGAAVYAPEREQEIIRTRTAGIEKAYVLESQAFFKQMMEISRAYQYAKLACMAEDLNRLPEGEGEAVIEFSCSPNDGRLAVFLNAAAIAGLTVKSLTVKDEKEMIFCRLCLFGDFSFEPAKGAVLQMLRENKTAVIRSGDSV